MQNVKDFPNYTGHLTLINRCFGPRKTSKNGLTLAKFADKEGTCLGFLRLTDTNSINYNCCLFKHIAAAAVVQIFAGNFAYLTEPQTKEIQRNQPSPSS
jgi:hypothetical protein